jgi:hypothetical protein
MIKSLENIKKFYEFEEYIFQMIKTKEKILK